MSFTTCLCIFINSGTNLFEARVSWCIMQCINVQSGATLFTMHKSLSYGLTWPKQHLYKIRAVVLILLEKSINGLINIFLSYFGRQIYNAQNLILELTIVNVTHGCSKLCAKQKIRGLVQLQGKWASCLWQYQLFSNCVRHLGFKNLQ